MVFYSQFALLEYEDKHLVVPDLIEITIFTLLVHPLGPIYSDSILVYDSDEHGTLFKSGCPTAESDNFFKHFITI